MSTCRLVLAGPASCGKSTLAVSLGATLNLLGCPTGVHELDVFSDTHECIVGAKPWSERKKLALASVSQTRPVLVRFATDERDIVLGDLAGAIPNPLFSPATNPYLPNFLEFAHGAILLCKEDLRGLAEWEQLLSFHGVPVVLRIVSYYRGARPQHVRKRGLVVLGGLNREVRTDLEIRSLAQTLLSNKDTLTQQLYLRSA